MRSNKIWVFCGSLTKYYIRVGSVTDDNGTGQKIPNFA
jgi:hypothetical protein